MQRLHLPRPGETVLGECQVGIQLENTLVGFDRVRPFFGLLLLLRLPLQRGDLLQPDSLVDLQQAVGRLWRTRLELLGHAKRRTRREKIAVGKGGQPLRHALVEFHLGNRAAHTLERGLCRLPGRVDFHGALEALPGRLQFEILFVREPLVHQ